MNKRQISAEETRKKLLNAAVSLLHEKGLPQSTLMRLPPKPAYRKEVSILILKEKKILFWK